MSEDPTLYQTRGDEALEARIVAWVLGEASPFEADELERLCAERPELQIFRRRIRAIDHWVGEAENPAADPAWQLDPARRETLEQAFGKPMIAPAADAAPDAPRVLRSRRSRTWMSAAASVAILIALGGLFAPTILENRKPAEADPTTAALQDAVEASESIAPAHATIAPEAIAAAPAAAAAQPAPADPSNRRARLLSPQVESMMLAEDSSIESESAVVLPQRRSSGERMAMRAESTKQEVIELPEIAMADALDAASLDRGRVSAAAALPLPEVSRFALNVHASSFAHARDALRRGDRPEPSQIRIEDFYNAFPPDAREFNGGGLVDAQFESIVDPAHEGYQLLRISARASGEVQAEVTFHPERVASWKLIGFDRNPAGPQDLAGVAAAGEIGSAIYQIRPRTAGQGDIGHIVMRTPNPATGDPIEQSWSITYRADAPTLDAASPSMQLATLAMFCAQHLRAEGSVDLSIDEDILHRLKTESLPNTRASELIEMLSRLMEP